METVKAAQVVPFVGPRPFKEEESQIFFGRKREILELTSLITAHPIVLLYAPSGAGKTSLVNAGLIPRLKGKKEESFDESDENDYGEFEAFDVLKPMRVRVLESASGVDNKTNIFMLSALLSSADKNVDVSSLPGMTLEQFLKSKPRRVNEYGEPLQRVVIFDQFEEIFTAYPERWEDRKNFFEQVSEALVGNPIKKIEGDPLLRVVFSMREDYIAELDPYSGLLPECLRTRFRLEQMKEKAAEKAVEVPFKKRDITFAPKVSNQLVKNLLEIPNRSNGNGLRFGQYVEPVQLQIVCQSLWEALEPGEKVITQDHLETHGDLSQVLSGFYEKGIKNVVEKTSESEAGLRNWFENTLIVEGNRAPVTQGKDKAGGMPNNVVELLEKKNLLKKEWRGSGTVLYELAHDHFIEPIRMSNQEWRGRQGTEAESLHHLEAKALKWQQGSGKLLDSEELLAADRLIEGPVEPSQVLQEFVTASHAAAQQKRYRIFKAGFAVLLFGLIAVTVLFFSAYRARGEAERARAEAEAARIDALSQRDEAKKQSDFAQETLKKEKNLKEVLEGKQAELQDALKESNAARDDAVQQRAVADQQRKIAEGEKIKAQRALDDAEAQRRIANDRATLLAVQKARAQSNARQANSSLLAITARSYLEDDPELSVLLAQKASGEYGKTRASEEVIRAGLAALSSGNKVLRKHNRRVNYVELSPDGKRVVTASDDNTAYLWKLDTNTSFELAKHTRPVIRASFSPDGKKIVTASLDGTALVWDGHTGAFLKLLAGHTAELSRAVWSPDSQFIATASDDATVKIWNASTGEDLTTLIGHKKAVHDLAWSPDGTYIATEGFDSTGRIWVLDNNKQVIKFFELLGLKGTAPAIAFSPNSKMLVTETGLGQATVWNVATGDKLFSVGDPSWATITSVAFSPDNKRFIMTSSDGTARVCRVETKGTLVSELRGHTRSIYVAQFSPDGQVVVTASADNKARVWDATTGQTLLLLNGHSGGVKSASFSPDSRNIIVTGSDDGTARVWNTTSGQQLMSDLPVQSAAVSSATFSPKFKFDSTDNSNAQANTDMVTTGYDGRLRIWDARTGTIRTTLPSSYARVSYAAFSSSGQYLVTTSFDKTATIWNVANGQLQPLFQLKGHSDRVVKAVFSPNAKFVVTVSYDGTARVWSTETGRQVQQLGERSSDLLFAVDYSPDGNSIVTAGKTVKIWDGHSFNFKQELSTGHEKDIYSVRYSPKGDYIVTASADGTARVWNATTLQKEAVLLGHTDDVNSAVFSPDAQFIATSSNDKTTRVWDTKTWKVISVLRGQKGKVFTATFSADSKYLVTASDDGTAHIYPPEMFAIPHDDLLSLIGLRILQRNLGLEEWLKFKTDTLPDQ